MKYYKFLLLLIALIMPTTSAAYAISQEDADAIFGNYAFFSPDTVSCSTTSLTGGNNVEISFNYFRGKGLTAEQSAGIVGNLQAESGPDINPEIYQQGGGPGRGIAQWEYKNGTSDRWSNALRFASAQNRDPYTLDLQLDYLWFEFTGEPPTDGATGGSESKAYDDLIKQTTVYDAAKSFMTKFERPKDQSDAKIQGRADLAQAVYAAFSGNVVSVAQTGGGSCVGTGASVSVDGLFFPLVTTQSRLDTAGERSSHGSDHWFPEQNSHGQGYLAHDIFEDQGTQVVAIEGGLVTTTRNRVGGVGTNITIVGENTKNLYYYTHMEYNSVPYSVGDQVQAGEPIGVIGNYIQAVKTQEHVHVDVTAPPATFREKCERAQLNLCQQINFVDYRPIYRSLYDALPE